MIPILFVKVVDERSIEDAGEGKGVGRHVLTEFWHPFFQSLVVGAVAKVPPTRRLPKRSVGSDGKNISA